MRVFLFLLSSFTFALYFFIKISFAAVDSGGGSGYPTCRSQGGGCIESVSERLCLHNGGHIVRSTGCSSTQECCVFPPPPNTTHECATNSQCPSGEECVRVDADTKICKPKKPSGGGGPLPGGGVNECTRGCSPDEVCVQLSGGRYCLPSCQSIGGSCKTSCATGEISNYGNYCSNNSNRCCTSPSASDLCYGRGGQCKFDDSSTSCAVNTNGYTQYSFPPCEQARYTQGFSYPGYACCIKPGTNGGRISLYDTSGKVFLDNNLNGKKDAGDSGYLGALIRIIGPSISITDGTDENGNYKFYGNRSGTYTVRLTVPANSRNTTPISRSVRLGPSVAGVNFGISPVYTISGSVFIDVNGNGVKDGSEVNYTGGGTRVTSGSGVVAVNQTQGTYIITGLLAGTYVVSYVSLPSGFQMSAPVNGSPPSFSVTVGPSCSVVNNNFTGAICIGANVVNLNFVLKQHEAWIQTYGFDVRFDDGYTNIIPSNPNYPSYAAVAGE